MQERSPGAVRPRDDALPIAEGSGLREAFRRVVYGGLDAGGNDGRPLGDATENGAAREDDGDRGDERRDVAQRTQQGIVLIADLERFESARAAAGCAPGTRRQLLIGAWHYLERQQEEQNPGDDPPTIHITMLVN